jgi:hypothetical protein
VKQNEVNKHKNFADGEIQKYLFILAVDECPQQSHFSILRVPTNVLEVELRLKASKRQKDGEISVGKITESLPIITVIRLYLTNCKYRGRPVIGWK